MKLIVVDNGNALINADTVARIEKERSNISRNDDVIKTKYSLVVRTDCEENSKAYRIGTYTSNEICSAAMYELSNFIISDGDKTFRAFNDEDFKEHFPNTKILR